MPAAASAFAARVHISNIGNVSADATLIPACPLGIRRAARDRAQADDETLVIDTMPSRPDSSGLGLNVPAGPRKSP
jgi:hypothetical protein